LREQEDTEDTAKK